MNKKEALLKIAHLGEWCKRVKGFSWTCKWATPELAEEMKKEHTAGFYVVALRTVVFNPEEVYMGPILHEIGHAYDYIVMGQQPTDDLLLEQETNAFYYGYKLALEYADYMEGAELYAYDLLLEIVHNAKFGHNQLYTQAAGLASNRLIKEGLLSKEEVSTMTLSILDAYMEQVAVAKEEVR